MSERGKPEDFSEETKDAKTKKRTWFVTLPADGREDEQALKKLLEDANARKAYTRITAQREISKKNYNHFHVLLECRNQVLFSTIKNIFPRGHISFVSGKVNMEKARRYCTKERTRVEGPWIFEADDARKRPASRAVNISGEKKSKLDLTYEMIETGEIRRYEELPPGIQMTGNFRYACAVIDRFNPPSAIRRIKVLVLYNGSGYGKSTNARLCLPDSGFVSFSRGEKAWFDGYEGQDALIIDEFEWGALPNSKFKQVLSGDLKKVEIKGAFIAARYTKILITTNTDPNTWGKRGHFATVTTRDTMTGDTISRRQWIEEEDDGSGSIKKDDLRAVKRRLGLDPQSDPRFAKCVNVLDLVDPSERTSIFGQTPKTWKNIQKTICEFFDVPLPEEEDEREKEEEEEEASLLNPQVVDLTSISPSQTPVVSPCTSPDLLALDSEPKENDEIAKRAGKNERFYVKTLPKLIEKYQKIGEFSKQEAEPLAKELLDDYLEKANKSGKLLKEIYREQFNDSDTDE